LKADDKREERRREIETSKRVVKCELVQLMNNFNAIDQNSSIFRVRQNRLRMQQEAQRDAPDPRESRPPCYSEAIRMPRLAAFASLNDLGRAKNKRRKTETEDDEHEEEVPLRRNRCRSEEVLSMRLTAAIVPRVHPFEGEMRDSQRETTAEAAAEDDEESFEEIRNFDQSANTLESGSPYSKRKQMARLQRSSEQPGPSTQQQQQPLLIKDDHFKGDDKSDSIEEREGSNEFITFEIKRQTDIYVPRVDSNDDAADEGRSRPTSF
jgi:hypothetical protein